MADFSQDAFDASEMVGMAMAQHHVIDRLHIDAEQVRIVHHDSCSQSGIQQNPGNLSI